jgi:hypothetical protein
MNRVAENSRRITGLRELSQNYSKIDPTQDYNLIDLKARIHDPKLVNQFQSAVRAVRIKLANS